MARLFEPGRALVAGVRAVHGAVELFPVLGELCGGLEGLVAVLAEGLRNVGEVEVRFELTRVDEGFWTFGTLVALF